MSLSDFVTVIQALTTLVVAVIAVVAWVAKIRWSQEFAQAKNEVIRAKEAETAVWKSQAETLSKLSPPTLHEYLTHTRDLIETASKTERSQLEGRIAELEASIAEERDRTAGESRRVAELLGEQARLQAREKELVALKDNWDNLLTRIDQTLKDVDTTLPAFTPTFTLHGGVLTGKNFWASPSAPAKTSEGPKQPKLKSENKAKE